MGDQLRTVYGEKKEYFISTLYDLFSDAINANLDMLVKLKKRAPVNQIAWYVRNLLELQIWVEFCSASDRNAAEFYEDAICDLVDLNRKPGERDPEMMALLEKAKQLISTQKQPHKYKKVFEAADALGKKDEKQTWREYYDQQNKLPSKFVHPTALSVVLPIPRNNVAQIQAYFVEDGEEYAREATKRLKASYIAETHRTFAPHVADAKRRMKKDRVAFNASVRS